MSRKNIAKTVLTSLLFGGTLLAPLYIIASSAFGQYKMQDTSKVTTKKPNKGSGKTKKKGKQTSSTTKTN